jgi:hypothetical protein
LSDKFDGFLVVESMIEDYGGILNDKVQSALDRQWKPG